MDIVSIGDSIATYPGLGSVLHAAEVRAVKGVPSSYIVGEAKSSGSHEICVISAGSNDPLNLNLKGNLEAIRKNVHCKIVVWVKPANGRASSVVHSVASEYGDKEVQLIPGPDHVHPRSYSELARNIINQVR